MTSVPSARDRDVHRIIIIWKMLQEAQRNAELASGALVSSAASSRDTGSRLIAHMPMRAERTKRTMVLSGRTLSENKVQVEGYENFGVLTGPNQ